MNPNIPKKPPITATKKQLGNGLLNLLVNNDDRYDHPNNYLRS